MKARTLLLVDLSNQIYRACHAHDSLTFDGYFTGGLYGFMQSVSKAIEVSGATDLVVCRDTKPYLRSRDYPAYKTLRKTKQDPDMRAMYDESEPLVLRFLDALGIPLWGVLGFECDDLIAYAVRHMRHRFTSICAMCGDSDLHQLFDVPNFRMYGNADKPLMTPTAFQKLYDGISTEEFILASAMAGTHNEIEGVRGVGLKTAVKIMRDAVRMRQFRAIHEELIDRNLRLIRLPHPELPHQVVPIRDNVGHHINDPIRDLYRFCGDYGIQTPAWMVSSFNQVL